MAVRVVQHRQDPSDAGEMHTGVLLTQGAEVGRQSLDRSPVRHTDAEVCAWGEVPTSTWLATAHVRPPSAERSTTRLDLPTATGTTSLRVPGPPGTRTVASAGSLRWCIRRTTWPQ